MHRRPARVVVVLLSFVKEGQGVVAVLDTFATFAKPPPSIPIQQWAKYIGSQRAALPTLGVCRIIINACDPSSIPSGTPRRTLDACNAHPQVRHRLRRIILPFKKNRPTAIGACTTPDFCDELTKIRYPGQDALDNFGEAVALDGNVALGGVPNDSCSTGTFCGTAVVFRFDGTSWNQEAILNTDDPFKSVAC